MSQTFTPVTGKFDPAQPKSWASELALLDWDKSSVVFTKRSFIEFLKSINVEVGPNFTEINKVPKYATFGKFSEPETAAPVAASEQAATPAVTPTSASTVSAAPASHAAHIDEPSVDAPWGANAMRPSRKVREPPGGKVSIRFGDYEEPSVVIPPPRNAPAAQAPVPEVDEWAPKEPAAPAASRSARQNPFERSEVPAYEPPRPSRRVRENPGGKSSMAALLSGGL